MQCVTTAMLCECTGVHNGLVCMTFSTYLRLNKNETIPPIGRQPMAALQWDAPGHDHALAVTLAQVT